MCVVLHPGGEAGGAGSGSNAPFQKMCSFLSTGRRAGAGGDEETLPEMGDVCREQRRSCTSVLWRLCNLCMCVFFGLATYVQVKPLTLPFPGTSLRLFTNTCLIADQRPRRWTVDGEVHRGLLPGLCGLTAAGLCCRSVMGSLRCCVRWSD